MRVPRPPSHEARSSPQINEIYHSYYDIFVRHAFGNLRDVLREVSRSPLMADFLTFLKSKGRHYTDLAPDENFAVLPPRTPAVPPAFD